MALDAFHWPGRRHGHHQAASAGPLVYVPSTIALKTRAHEPHGRAHVRVTDALPEHRPAEASAPGPIHLVRTFAHASVAPIVRSWRLEGSLRVRLGGAAAMRPAILCAHGVGTLRSARASINPSTGDVTLRTPFLLLEARLSVPSSPSAWPRHGVLDAASLRLLGHNGCDEPVSLVVQRVFAHAGTYAPFAVHGDQRSVEWSRGAASTHLLFSCHGGVFDLSPNPTRLQVDVGRGTGVAMCDGYVLEFSLKFGEQRASRVAPTHAVSAHWLDIDPETGGVYDGQLPVRRVVFHLDVGRVSIWYDQEDCAPTTSTVVCRVTRKLETPRQAPRIQRIDSATVHDGTVVLSGLFETPAGQRHPLACLSAGSDLVLLSGGDTSAQLYSLARHD